MSLWHKGQAPLSNKSHLRRTGVLALGGLLVLGISACEAESEGDAASSVAGETSTATPTSPPAQESPALQAPVAPPAPTTDAAPAVDFAMPDLVGMDLQTAQNLVQTQGVWLSVSHDLLGSRNQIVDSNWIVCDQNIAPGQRVTGAVEGEIDFGVVKRGEPCP